MVILCHCCTLCLDQVESTGEKSKESVEGALSTLSLLVRSTLSTPVGVHASLTRA